MSEHQLFDNAWYLISSYEDKIAEIAQSKYGNFKLNEIKPIAYKISNGKKFLENVLADAKNFLKTIQTKDLVGMKSEVESFIGEINIIIYRYDLCLKESLKKRLISKINENKIQISESNLRNLIREALYKTLIKK